MGLKAVGRANQLVSPTIAGQAGFASGTASAVSLYWTADGASGFGWYRGAAQTWTIGAGGGNTASFAANSFGLNSVAGLHWSATTDSTAAKDTTLSRIAAGVVGVGTGTAAEVDGAMVASHYRTSAPVTETGTTHTVAVTTSHLITNQAGAVTVTLPAAASFTGRQLWIRAITNGTVVSAASDVVPQVGGSAGTAIIGAVDGGWALLVSDGTAWQIMASSAV